jgi:hypothetical protein
MSSFLVWDGGFAEVGITKLVAPKKIGRKSEPIVVNMFGFSNQETDVSLDYFAVQILRTIRVNVTSIAEYAEFDCQTCVDVGVFGTIPSLEYISTKVLHLFQESDKYLLCISEGVVRHSANL